jgi:hypothetical protein
MRQKLFPEAHEAQMCEQFSFILMRCDLRVPGLACNTRKHESDRAAAAAWGRLS